MNKDSKIYIAGHRGLVGSAILKRLESEGYTNLIYRTSQELDLTNQKKVRDFFWDERPEYVILTAAKAGGVMALNTLKADSIYVNLQIQNNVIHNANKFGCKKLLFIASNCVYPKLVTQPIKEEYLFAGKLEPTVDSYAVAKLAGIKMCQAYREQYGANFISALPVNLYGNNEKYIENTSHVMTSLLHKFYLAKKNNLPSVEIWGSGNARREFMHVDDFADACLFLMNNYDGHEQVNVGAGFDISIKELAESIKTISGYSGQIIYNTDKPDGVMSKLLDSSKIAGLGWVPKTILRYGIEQVYKTMFTE